MPQKNVQAVSITISLLYIMFSFIDCQSLPKHLIYMGEPVPQSKAKIFAPGKISQTHVSEFGSVFNKKGDEFYFAIDTAGKAEILYCFIDNRSWTKPVTIISHEKYSFNDPFLSPKEDRLYYISDMPSERGDTSINYDIWYSERVGNRWSDPINAGDQINSEFNEYYISFTSDGSMYFASNKENAPKRKRDFEIYKSAYSNAAFQIPEKLSEAVNSKWYDADVFIAPDESYIIFCAIRKIGLGRGDLYISFKTADGKWTPSKNMGPAINSDNHELCPYVTADGKYLFYTSNQDIYWISMEVIESLR